MLKPLAKPRGGLAAGKHWLKREIEERFGPLSPESGTRIDAIDDEAALEAIRARLGQVSRIDDLFVP